VHRCIGASAHRRIGAENLKVRAEASRHERKVCRRKKKRENVNRSGKAQATTPRPLGFSLKSENSGEAELCDFWCEYRWYREQNQQRVLEKPGPDSTAGGKRADASRRRSGLESSPGLINFYARGKTRPWQALMRGRQ
jgi:hypothetical protein